MTVSRSGQRHRRTGPHGKGPARQAGLAALVLTLFLNAAVPGVILSAVAGIMVIISLDELVPVSRSLGEEHLSIVGVVAGVAVMALSLWML